VRSLAAVEEGLVCLYVSEATLAELREVLSRREMRIKRPHMTADYVDIFVERVRRSAVLVDSVPSVLAFPRDPKDEPYLNLLIASGASYLISRDRDLLDLAKPESAVGSELRRHAPAATIVDPFEFLDVLLGVHERRTSLAVVVRRRRLQGVEGGVDALGRAVFDHIREEVAEGPGGFGYQVEAEVAGFQNALDDEQGLHSVELAVGFVELFADDDVDHAALVFQEEEEDALGGVGPLAGGDQAGDHDPGLVFALAQAADGDDGAGRGHGAEQRPDQLDRMLRDAEAHGVVLAGHVLPF
jgi:putative PIN family toxin of toxin-antitoxin system